ncbi:hypothetical protein BX600DRAFT_511059 [Xylariales sp. PMI_506]|nr:hypothetical protein BX600DRAFT_511059 [Xylariales sp. PMI_506]
MVLVVTGAIIGGVVGSQQHHASYQPTETPRPTSNSIFSSATTTTAPASTTQISTALPTRQPSLSAAVIDGLSSNLLDDSNDYAVIQIFYQVDSDETLRYRLMSNGNQYGLTYNLTLSLAVQSEGPFAVSSRLDNSSTLVNLFYFHQPTTDTGTRIDVVMAALRCDYNIGCFEINSTIITANATENIHPQSRIAVVWLENSDTDFRVYYQSEGGSIIENSGGNAASSGWSTSSFAVDAVSGTSIAVLWAPGPTINVFYVGADLTSTMPMLLPYGTKEWQMYGPLAINNGSDAGKTINSTAAAASGWDRAVQLAACYEAALDTYRVYYAESQSGTIFEYSRAGSSGNWTLGTSWAWGTPDNGIGAVGWGDEVSLFYLTDGSLEQSSLKNGSWTGPTLV